MSWKTTDSAKRSGISDYNRGTIKQNTERFTADYGVISDLSLQNLYGFRDDGVNPNTLNIKADSLAFNKYDSSGVTALRIAVDSFNNALIGRKVSGIDAGIPDLSDSLCFTEDGTIVVFGDTPYTIPNTGGTLKPTFTVKGDVGVEEELYVDGSSHFYNSVDISGHVTLDSSMVINGDLTVFGVILPHFIGVSGDFRVGKDLLVVGDTSLHHFSATDGSINDLSVNYFHLLNDGYVNPGATLRIDGSMVINGELIFTGNATEIGTVSISGDASYNGFLYGSKNLYLGSKHQQDDQPGQASKFIQATYTSMLDGSSISMCFGQDISPGNQGQLSYYHNSDDSSRNTVTLGVSGKNNIAINSNGNVSIGRNLSNVTTNSSLDVSGSVTVAAQSDYIYTTPSLHIDNTSRYDSTGASIKLTGKRNYWSENKPSNEYPYLTGADIIFENFNDANINSGSDAKIATTKIHGVIKTFQTDNSWNIGDMGFYGQDNSSLYAGTDTSGITEFMRFDASNQKVRFSKDVGIGGVTGPNVMQLVPGGHVLPQYPDISAVLDLRTYTYFGQSGRSEQPNWKGSNILLAPENKNTGVPSGLIWKTLAGDISGSYKDDYINTEFKGNYTKDSAAIKFMPAADYYRGGLAFFTNDTADRTTNAVERMRIDLSGNVGIGTSTPSSTLDVSGDFSVQGQSTFNSNATMSYGASLDFNNDQNQLSANITVDSNNILKINNSEGVSIPSDVKGNLTLTTGYLSRDTHDSSGTDVPHGYLVGNYIFDGSYVGKKSYPIFALSNDYAQKNHISSESVPYGQSGTNLGFYGIGYTQDSNNGLLRNSDSITHGGWGMYVGAHDNIGCFLDGGEGTNSFINAENGGNVGIGTKGPSQKLDVRGNTNITGNLYLGDTSKGLINGYQNRILSLHSHNKPRLSVMTNDNVSIGNNSSGDSLDAPALLTVGHSITPNTNHNDTSFGAGTKILLGNEGSNTENKYVIGFGAFNANVLTGTHYPPAYIGYEQKVYTGNTGYGDLIFGTKNNPSSAIEATEHMRIQNSGYIGIGTKTPSEMLDVNGSTNIKLNLSVGGNTSLNGTVSSHGTTTFHSSSQFVGATTIQGDLTTNNITINGNTTINSNINATGQQIDCKFINTTNNVGIGINYDPDNMFTVAHGSSISNPTLSVNQGIVAIGAQASSQSQQPPFLYVNGATELGSNVTIEGNVTMGGTGDTYTFTLNGKDLSQIISDSHGSEDYAKLHSSPSFTGIVSAPSFNATSDVNKKEDIETISDATEKLTSLRGVSYKLKEDEKKKTHYGVVAQELEKVFPDMVHGEEGDKSVAYMEIIGVLIETVKDLNKRVKKLEESSK